MKSKIYRYDTMLQAGAAAEEILKKYDCPKLELKPTADGRAIIVVTYEKLKEESTDEADAIHH